MIGNVLNIAASGLAAAQAQFAATADNIANADTPGYQARRVDLVELSTGGVGVAGITTGGSVDLANESVDLIRERMLYGANAAVLRTADQMLGTLLNITDDGRHRDGDRDNG